MPDGIECQGAGMTKSISFDDSSHNNVNANNHTPKLQFLPMIEIKEIACYLSLLEGGDVQDKLECKFLSLSIRSTSLILLVNRFHGDKPSVCLLV